MHTSNSFKIRTKETHFVFSPIPGQHKIAQWIVFLDKDSPFKSSYPVSNKQEMINIIQNTAYKQVAVIHGGDLMATTKLCHVDEIVDFFDRLCSTNTILEIFDNEEKKFPIRIEFPIERDSSEGFWIYAHPDAYEKIIKLLKDRHDVNDSYTAKTTSQKISELLQNFNAETGQNVKLVFHSSKSIHTRFDRENCSLDRIIHRI